MAQLSTNQHGDDEKTFNLEEMTYEDIEVLQESLRTLTMSMGLDREKCENVLIKEFIDEKVEFIDILYKSLDLEEV